MGSKYTPQTIGPQKPEKYTSIGPRYKQYGEQPGFIYFPQTDRYYIDPKAVKTQKEAEGLIEKKAGLGATLLPLAAASAIPVLTSEAVKGIGGLLFDKATPDVAKNAFDFLQNGLASKVSGDDYDWLGELGSNLYQKEAANKTSDAISSILSKGVGSGGLFSDAASDSPSWLSQGWDWLADSQLGNWIGGLF